ncbi:exopolysaccharide biosynthesis protein [Psychrobacter sp. DM8]|uniref:exopolysaccharide biosynthesis protein n=1 Tax=unclassified Psychrobacter TaxID=196806 RepID=UPI003F50B8AA
MLESKTSSKSKDSKDDTSVSAQSTEQSGASHSSHSDTSLTTVLHKIEPDKNTDKVSIGDVMSALSEKGFGPLLFAPALIAIMPTGGIPGVPTVCGVIIALISIQMLFGKQRPWLPKFIDKVSFEQDKLHKGVAIAEKATKRIDKIVKPRLTVLSSDKAKKLAAAVCVFAALAMIPLEVVPFAVMIPAAAIILFAIGLITEDGYVFLAALLLSIVTAYFLVTQVLMG